MCCEDCPQVAHYGCIGLKRAPQGDWWCKDCEAKKANKKKSAASGKVNKDTKASTVMTRKSRRNGR